MYQLITPKRTEIEKVVYNKPKKNRKKENTAYFKLQSAYFVNNE